MAISDRHPGLVPDTHNICTLNTDCTDHPREAGDGRFRSMTASLRVRFAVEHAKDVALGLQARPIWAVLHCRLSRGWSTAIHR